MSDTSDNQAKRAKMTEFWTSGNEIFNSKSFKYFFDFSVGTRKNGENSECWKLIRGTVLSKIYGQSLEKETCYKVFAFDLV